MAHTKVTKTHSQNTGAANTFSYSGSFDVFKASEVTASLDGVALTFQSGTIDESASPREYTVDTTAKTIHIGGADLSSGTITIRPETDLGAPSPRATYTPGASVTSTDLNNNQLQLMRKAMEYDETKMSSTGTSVMTGDLKLGQNINIQFEGSADDAYETTLTVANPTADRTITLPNVTGTAVTTGDTGTVATGMVADDAITADKLANSINSEIAANTSKTTNQTHTGDVTGSVALTIANDAVTTAKIADANVTSTKLASNSVTTSNITDANVTTVKVADANITLAKLASDLKQTSISNSDTQLPTSGAVVDYVTDTLTSAGSFEVIADEDNFPATHPDPKASASVAGIAGMVVSIQNAGGLQINSSGVATNARKAGSGSDDITINGFPSSMRAGVNGNATPYELTDETGLLVTTTAQTDTAYASGAVYEFHRVFVKPADYVQLSDDINDFNNRYRVNAGEPGSNNDEGDLVYDTTADKMKVYDSTTSSWKELTTTGDFKYLFLCPAGGSGAPTLDGSIATYDLREGSNSGTAANITNAAQLIVSLNGVIQKANTGTSAPAEGFALVDANTIIFGSNLASGDSVFITQIGSAVTVPTPADNSVTTAKIASNAVTTAKILDSNVTTAKIADANVTKAKIENLINNNADNRIITGSGTANTLEGESDLTFSSGSGLQFDDDNTGIDVDNSGTTNKIIFHDSDTSVANDQTIGRIEFHSSYNTSNGRVAYIEGAHMMQYGGGELIFGATSINSTTNVKSLGVYASAVSIFTKLRGVAIGDEYVILSDVKDHGVNGGSFTNGSLQTRDLNTITQTYVQSWITLDTGTGEFTINEAGTYLFYWQAPAFDVSVHRSYITNDDGTILLYGQNASNNTTNPTTTISAGWGRIEQTAASEGYFLKHQCNSTKGTTGFGADCNFGSEQEFYSQVIIMKEENG